MFFSDSCREFNLILKLKDLTKSVERIFAAKSNIYMINIFMINNNNNKIAGLTYPGIVVILFTPWCVSNCCSHLKLFAAVGNIV